MCAGQDVNDTIMSPTLPQLKLLIFLSQSHVRAQHCGLSSRGTLGDTTESSVVRAKLETSKVRLNIYFILAPSVVIHLERLTSSDTVWSQYCDVIMV